MVTASRAVRMVTGRKDGRGTAAVRGSGMCAGTVDTPVVEAVDAGGGPGGPDPAVGEGCCGTAVTGRTGTRSTVPQGQPSSGCGHWSRRPHWPHRTVTHSSVQVRWVIGSAGAPLSRGGTTGAPHGHG
ncbi:hypothetical protein GCM10010273_27470 [Streptomyces lavendulocolor]